MVGFVPVDFRNFMRIMQEDRLGSGRRSVFVY